MLGRLNHVAIAVPDLEAATKSYSNTLGATVSAPKDIPEHGVTVVFVELENTKIELLCYEVDDLTAARDQLTADGARVLGSGEPKIGAHGKPVLFLHPKDFSGTLIELEQT
jgi:methylmalonyl-CoA/ethylmalonyl-CoA epimerase